MVADLVSNADCVADEMGLLMSLVLSTLDKPRAVRPAVASVAVITDRPTAVESLIFAAVG